MNHKQIKKFLPIYLYGDFAINEAEEIRRHLETCSECRNELESLKAFNAALSHQHTVEVTEALLSEARQQLHAALQHENAKQSLWENVKEKTIELFAPRYRVAFSAATTLVIGVGIGYVLFHQTSIKQMKESGTQMVSQASQTSKQSFLRGDTRTENLHFLNLDSQTGEVEFTFDAITPMRVKGNVDDEQVQKVMARAIVNSDNPGVRLRAVSALAEQGESATDGRDVDPAVKSALITALKADANPGVRREALRALTQMPFDKEIKEAILFVLMHDKNSGMRVAAINSLELSSHEKRLNDSDILKALKKKMESDNNNYVRLQARTVLQEVSQ